MLSMCFFGLFIQNSFMLSFLKKIVFYMKSLFLKKFLGKILGQFFERLRVKNHKKWCDFVSELNNAKFYIYEHKDVAFTASYHFEFFDYKFRKCVPYDFFIIRYDIDFYVFEKQYSLDLKSLYYLFFHKNYFIDPYNPLRGVCRIVEIKHELFNNREFYTLLLNRNKFDMIYNFMESNIRIRMTNFLNLIYSR